MATTVSGTPTRANSAKPNRSAPASAAASAMITFTGLPVSRISDPALAAKANGISSWEGRRRWRTATTTTIGSRAATAPLMLISAVSPAAISMVNSISRRLLSPATVISRWPIQVVTPVASRPSLTTKRAAMKITVGSPKPAIASRKSMTPTKKRASAEPMATTSTGSRFQMNRATTTASRTKVSTASLMGSFFSTRQPRWSPG